MAIDYRPIANFGGQTIYADRLLDDCVAAGLPVTDVHVATDGNESDVGFESPDPGLDAGQLITLDVVVAAYTDAGYDVDDGDPHLQVDGSNLFTGVLRVESPIADIRLQETDANVDEGRWGWRADLSSLYLRTFSDDDLSTGIIATIQRSGINASRFRFSCPVSLNGNKLEFDPAISTEFAMTSSTASPEGAQAAPVGSVHHSSAGGFYHKRSGVGNTGWSRIDGFEEKTFSIPGPIAVSDFLQVHRWNHAGVIHEVHITALEAVTSGDFTFRTRCGPDHTSYQAGDVVATLTLDGTNTTEISATGLSHAFAVGDKLAPDVTVANGAQPSSDLRASVNVTIVFSRT